MEQDEEKRSRGGKKEALSKVQAWASGRKRTGTGDGVPETKVAPRQMAARGSRDRQKKKKRGERKRRGKGGGDASGQLSSGWARRQNGKRGGGGAFPTQEDLPFGVKRNGGRLPFMGYEGGRLQRGVFFDTATHLGQGKRPAERTGSLRFEQAEKKRGSKEKKGAGKGLPFKVLKKNAREQGGWY